MQALWSRAAQARSCGCRSCLTTTTTISRQATTASPRRGLKAGDLFTACYTAMFATAALADLKFKEDRRKRWDTAIEEARAGGIGGQRVERTSLTQVNGCGHEEEFPDAALGLCQQAFVSGSLANYHLHSTGSYMIETEPLVAHLNATSQSQAAEWKTVQEHPEDDGFKDRSPRSRVHLDHMEGMVARLVTRLLIGMERAANSTGSRATSHSTRNETLNSSSRRREVFEDYNCILPAYAVLPLDTMRAEHASLNRSLMEVFRSSDPGNLRTSVGKLCHNLLVSSTPPNVDTYSLMIQQFTRLGQHHLADVVVDSFLKESRLKPKTQTVTLILRHYVASRDRTGFEKIISRMKGLNGDFHIKRRTKNDLRYRDVCQWAASSKVTYRNGLITQKVTRDAQIFETLINGFVEFSRLNRAVRYVRAAFREGCQISSETLRRVIQACLVSLDLEAAVKLLAAISAYWGEDVVANMRTHEQHIRHDVYRLLHFCGVPATSKLSLMTVPKGVDQKCLDYMMEELRFQVSGLFWERDVIGELSSVLARSGAQLRARQLQVIECFLAKLSPVDKRIFERQRSRQPRESLSIVLRIWRKSAGLSRVEDRPMSDVMRPVSHASAVDIAQLEPSIATTVATPRRILKDVLPLHLSPHLPHLRLACDKQHPVDAVLEDRFVGGRQIQLWRLSYSKISLSRALGIDNPYRVYDGPNESQLAMAMA